MSEQGETTAARRDGAAQGNCQRTKKSKSLRTAIWQGPWSTITSHNTNHTVSEPRHGRKDTGKEHREKMDKPRIPQRRTRCGLRSCLLDSNVLDDGEERSKWLLIRLQSAKMGRMREHKSGSKRPSLQIWVAREEGGWRVLENPPTVGHVLVQPLRDADERVRCWNYLELEMRGTDEED